MSQAGEAKKWDTYEEVSQYLLNQFAEQFGLEKVEAKQKVVGLRSGTEWTIDCKGIRLNDDGFVMVECRRHTTNKQKQEQIAALAYRIHDTGAKGGIIVSVFGIQEGAQKIADAENIISVKLHEDSTTDTYVMEFLNQIMVGVSDTLNLQESLHCLIERKIPDGTIETSDHEIIDDITADDDVASDSLDAN